MTNLQLQFECQSKIAVFMTLLFFVLLYSNTAKANAIDTVGQEPYEQCGFCHEYDGNSRMSSFPRLAGQKQAYIIKQLQDFRAGKRQGKMQATAELLNDHDITVVANYFSQQKVVNNNDKISQRLPHQEKLANKLYLNGDPVRGLQACVNCHGKSALGFNTIPRLAGQHEQYLMQQLVMFKNGTRKNDNQATMRGISQLLSQSEMKALVRYLSTLKPVLKLESPQFKKITINSNLNSKSNIRPEKYNNTTSTTVVKAQGGEL